MSLSPFIHRDQSPSPAIEYNANRPANFLAKLYHALNEDSNAKQAMYWSPDGFQLIVADPKLLETHVLPYHYKHCKFTSFCRQLNIYGFARVYPGRHFEDANGELLCNASVWAHPTLHRDSKMEELLAVKRRAPPRLFRNRKVLPHHQIDPSHRAQDLHWSRHHPYSDATFLPVLDLNSPFERRERKRDHPDQASAYTYGKSDQSAMRGKHLETRRTYLEGIARSDKLFEANSPNSFRHAVEVGREVLSPTELSDQSSEVPSPQQIIQAMARSRIATHSTPTTPRMNPWKYSSWNNVSTSTANVEILGTTPESDKWDAASKHEPELDFSLTAIRSVKDKARSHAPAGDTASSPYERGLLSSQYPHYVIEPDMTLLQPLDVPSYGDKPLPAPAHWSEQATFIPSCLPYVVSVPPAGSKYAAIMQQQSPFTTKDVIETLGAEMLQPSYLVANSELF